MPSMNISLTPELIKYVESQVESGSYKDASEFVSDAIRSKNQNMEMIYQVKLNRLRKALEPGLRDAAMGNSKEYSSLEEFMKDFDGEEKNIQTNGGSARNPALDQPLY